MLLLAATAATLTACAPPVSGPAGTPAPAPHILLAPNSLLAGDQLATTNGYTFSMQTDGNAVLRDPKGKALWSPRTDGNPGSRITMLADGNLAVTSDIGHPLWINGKNTHPGSYLELGTDGNLVQYQPVQGGRIQVWATNTAAIPSDKTATGCPAGANHALCASSVASARSNTAARAIKFAFAQLDKPYQSANRFGPHGYDCSGLMWQSYRNAGIDIGANLSSTIVTPGGPRRSIQMGEVRPGDIIWYQGHVAMALSNGKMLEAARPGTNVRIANTTGRGFSRAVAISAN